MFAKLKNESHCDVGAVIFFYIRKLNALLSKFASRIMLELMAEEMTWKSIMWHLDKMISNEQLWLSLKWIWQMLAMRVLQCNSTHDCYVHMKCSASYSTAQAFETYNSVNFFEVFLEFFFARRIMNLVASDWINLEVSRAFLSRVLT